MQCRVLCLRQMCLRAHVDRHASACIYMHYSYEIISNNFRYLSYFLSLILTRFRFTLFFCLRLYDCFHFHKILIVHLEIVIVLENSEEFRHFVNNISMTVYDADRETD